MPVIMACNSGTDVALLDDMKWRQDMKDDFGATIEPGDRVAMLPHTDLFMRGGRFGTVVKVGRVLVHVSIDVTGKTVRTSAHNVRVLDV